MNKEEDVSELLIDIGFKKSYVYYEKFYKNKNYAISNLNGLNYIINVDGVFGIIATDVMIQYLKEEFKELIRIKKIKKLLTNEQ